MQAARVEHHDVAGAQRVALVVELQRALALEHIEGLDARVAVGRVRPLARPDLRDVDAQRVALQPLVGQEAGHALDGSLL